MNLPAISRACLPFLLAAICTACDSREQTDTDRPATTIDSVRAVATPGVVTGGPNACTQANGLPGSLAEIASTASSLLSGPDSCVTALIDSLGARVGRDGGRETMVALDSLAIAADGYASEAISTLMPEIFRRSPETVVRYLVDTRNRQPQALRDALVAGFSLERPTRIDPAAQIDLDRQLFELIGNGMDKSGDERPFLDSLMRECLADTTQK